MKKTFKMAVFTAVTVLGLCLLSCDIPAVLDGLGGSAKTKAPDYSSFIPKNGITATFSGTDFNGYRVYCKVYFYENGTYISSNPESYNDAYEDCFVEPIYKGTWKFKNAADSFESGTLILTVTHWFDDIHLEPHWEEDLSAVLDITCEHNIVGGYIGGHECMDSYCDHFWKE